METSKAYFEDILHRFDTERRGRTLFQFCRDEGVDYKGLMAYKRSAGPKGKGGKKTTGFISDSDMDELEKLIELTVVEDTTITPSQAQWQVVSLAVRTPEGDIINLNCDSAPAVARLLSKLTES